jgi:hypothetical protein
MALELRCPAHPEYRGVRKPGDTALQDGLVAPSPDPARGAQSCPDCWELFRLKHEGA